MSRPIVRVVLTPQRIREFLGLDDMDPDVEVVAIEASSNPPYAAILLRHEEFDDVPEDREAPQVRLERTVTCLCTTDIIRLIGGTKADRDEAVRILDELPEYIYDVRTYFA